MVAVIAQHPMSVRAVLDGGARHAMSTGAIRIAVVMGSALHHGIACVIKDGLVLAAKFQIATRLTTAARMETVQCLMFVLVKSDGMEPCASNPFVIGSRTAGAKGSVFILKSANVMMDLPALSARNESSPPTH